MLRSGKSFITLSQAHSGPVPYRHTLIRATLSLPTLSSDSNHLHMPLGFVHVLVSMVPSTWQKLREVLEEQMDGKPSGAGTLRDDLPISVLGSAPNV